MTQQRIVTIKIYQTEKGYEFICDPPYEVLLAVHQTGQGGVIEALALAGVAGIVRQGSRFDHSLEKIH